MSRDRRANKPRPLDQEAESRFFAGVEYVGEFFMERSKVHLALNKLVSLLREANIPYAIVGAMALNEYGYRRATEDIDILLTREGLEKFKARYLGRGYVEQFSGSKGLRDTEHNVHIDVVLAGEYPGDGKRKSIVFPDPDQEALSGAKVRLLSLARLIELKLASGMTAPHRLRDLADVIEVIRACKLDKNLSDRLDPMVRKKYQELWEAAQCRDPE